MDAHYDQVQRARAKISDGEPRLYFAYSTVLDRAAFEEWRTQHGYEDFDLPQGTVAEARDIGLTFDFPSRWWGGRVAGLTDAPGQHVYGLLLHIAPRDWPIVQHKEGAITGMCVERELDVFTADGKRVRATAFTTAPMRATLEGDISPRFVTALVRGAEAAGLPSSYVQELKDLAR